MRFENIGSSNVTLRWALSSNMDFRDGDYGMLQLCLVHGVGRVFPDAGSCTSSFLGRIV
uniref:hypothetical protein n=1 Tax=Paenibacillus sp. FSL R10-2782 TaxID=2954661 RepID=UPI00406C741D